MKNLILVIAIFCSAGLVTAQQPELIDRELFFGNPEYAGAQISPDGKFISFIKPLDGVRNVWVKGYDEPFEKARPLTAEKKRPIASYFWSRDSKYTMFVKDNDGDENFNVFMVNPSAQAAAGSNVPAPLNLTNAKGVRVIIYNVPDTDPDHIYIGINERDKAWHDLYKVQISTGNKTLVRENKDRITGWTFDNANRLRMASRSTPAGDSELLSVNGNELKPIYSCNAFESCGTVGFDKANKFVYFVTNKGDRDLTQLVVLDPQTGTEKFVEEDPLKRVDFGGANFSNVNKGLIATTYTDDKTRIYWKDKKFENDYNTIKKRLGDREIAFGSATADESKFIVSTYSDVDPGTVWTYDRKSKNISTLYQVREKLPRASLSPMRAVRYPSSDGLEVPGYLTLPNGLPEKGLPLIVVPHGGPWGRDTWGYSSMAQFLANRGYAVLQPNFRASTGYGKRFLNAGNNEWGQKMQDDITWGVKYLVDQGIADPKRVGIMGGSYGGYATLAGVTYTPDTYAAAVAIVAPSNLQTLLEAIPPYWEAIRAVFYKRMGDPNTPEGLAQMKRQSPLYSADKIKTPLMVVQGANDPRVNKREADQIVVALRDRNYPVQYLLADDEGHGFQRPVNNMAMFAASEKFLANYLGGRFQDSMSAEVAKRLGEITVDPKNVTLASPAKAASSGPTSNISGQWNLVVEVPGRSVDVLLEVKQTGDDLSGTLASSDGNGVIEKGKVSGKSVTMTIKMDLQGTPTELQFDGILDGANMTGTISVPGFGNLSFVGSKGK